MTLSFSWDEPPVECSGCGKIVEYHKIEEHHNQCRRWHMNQVINAKNRRRTKSDRPGKQVDS